MAEQPIREAVARALAEDRAHEDVTTALLGEVADRPTRGVFVVEEECVLAGVGVVAEVFEQLHVECVVAALASEGEVVGPDVGVIEVQGPLHALLAGERVALNFLQRLTGIATATRRAVEAVAGTGATITDTRKTTPGLRALERHAVRVGGGVNHRFSLGEAVLWKDNHWAALNAAGGALADALAHAPAGVPVIVEVETEEQLEAALAAKVPRILMDNRTPEELAAWVARCGPDVIVEASGGLTLDTVAAYARAGAHFLSLGSLTHTVRAAAIRMDLQP